MGRHVSRSSFDRRAEAVSAMRSVPSVNPRSNRSANVVERTSRRPTRSVRAAASASANAATPVLDRLEAGGHVRIRRTDQAIGMGLRRFLRARRSRCKTQCSRPFVSARGPRSMRSRASRLSMSCWSSWRTSRRSLGRPAFGPQHPRFGTGPEVMRAARSCTDDGGREPIKHWVAALRFLVNELESTDPDQPRRAALGVSSRAFRPRRPVLGPAP